MFQQPPVLDDAVAHAQQQARPVPAPEPPSPVAEALRAEILRLITDGDKRKGGAITPELLGRIVRVAKTGRDVLVAIAISPSQLAGLIKRKRMPFGSIGLDIPDEMIENMVGDDSDTESFGGGVYGSQMMGGNVLAPAAPIENFGMTAIRELVSAAKALNGSESPAKLVEALAIARKENMADVVLELETKLGISKPSVVDAKLKAIAARGDEDEGSTDDSLLEPPAEENDGHGI